MVYLREDASIRRIIPRSLRKGPLLNNRKTIMKKIFVGAIGALATSAALVAHADTVKVNSTAHWVQMDAGQPVEMPNGAKGRTTMRAHATVMQADGSLSSQWCTGHQGVGPSGEAGGAGYCTAFSDNGDMLYISYVLGGPDQGGKWMVMGGTGSYAGATGSGTTKVVSRRSDGQAWTSQSMGSIMTP
ncbi:MAG: hypothetical protein ACI8RN_000775 [Glaciecola sp.]|jgi:hypothetical protein